MDKPSITTENVSLLFDSRYVKVFDLQYAPGHHYYDATRRSAGDLVAIKSDEAAKSMTPDAVSCIVILRTPDEEPRILFSHEFRYPAGRFLLSIPAGLIDPADLHEENPLFTTAIREIHEETGLVVKDTDQISLVSPFLYSTPGMTDESNALVSVVMDLPDLTALTQSGAEGSECFDGFTLLTRAEARKVLEEGRDEFGNFYSVYTWAALMYFVSDLW